MLANIVDVVKDTIHTFVDNQVEISKEKKDSDLLAIAHLELTKLIEEMTKQQKEIRRLLADMDSRYEPYEDTPGLKERWQEVKKKKARSL